MGLTMKLLDTRAAAKRLGVSERRIRALCKRGRLGRRIGSRWIIVEAEVKAFKRLPPGRPRKPERDMQVRSLVQAMARALGVSTVPHHV